MKLKKKQKLEEQVEEEEPDIEPPKKKKKKDKVTVDQENGHVDEATDMNGNAETSPKKKSKKSSDANTEVCVLF